MFGANFSSERGTEDTEKESHAFLRDLSFPCSVNSVRNPSFHMTELERLNKITEKIIGEAIEVHRKLGPGLLESAYEACLAYRLKKAGMEVELQKAVPLVYEEVKLECGYRMDMLVERLIVVEIKSVEALAPVHEAQTLSYLRLSGSKIALLINFNVVALKNGIKRFINGAV